MNGPIVPWTNSATIRTGTDQGQLLPSMARNATYASTPVTKKSPRWQRVWVQRAQVVALHKLGEGGPFDWRAIPIDVEIRDEGRVGRRRFHCGKGSSLGGMRRWWRSASGRWLRRTVEARTVSVNRPPFPRSFPDDATTVCEGHVCRRSATVGRQVEPVPTACWSPLGRLAGLSGDGSVFPTAGDPRPAICLGDDVLSPHGRHGNSGIGPRP